MSEAKLFKVLQGGHQIATSFISVCFSSRVAALGGPGACSTGKFLKFYMVYCRSGQLYSHEGPHLKIF